MAAGDRVGNGDERLVLALLVPYLLRLVPQIAPYLGEEP
jgi:hypothetical protein